MGQYKVPQNVEAEDKILGPFSFRQFIYLLIALGCGAAIWGLFSVAWPLIFIPLPFMLLCLALALPLRKDQPMETYLLAIIKYIFLPKKRLWRAGSFTPNVDVEAAVVVEGPAVKDIRGADASNRLSFLAQVVDTAGWSTRGATMQHPNENINVKATQDALKNADSNDQFEASSQTAQTIEAKLTGKNLDNPAIISGSNV